MYLITDARCSNLSAEVPDRSGLL